MPDPDGNITTSSASQPVPSAEVPSNIFNASFRLCRGIPIVTRATVDQVMRFARPPDDPAKHAFSFHVTAGSFYLQLYSLPHHGIPLASPGDEVTNEHKDALCAWGLRFAYREIVKVVSTQDEDELSKALDYTRRTAFAAWTYEGVNPWAVCLNLPHVRKMVLSSATTRGETDAPTGSSASPTQQLAHNSRLGTRDFISAAQQAREHSKSLADTLAKLATTASQLSRLDESAVKLVLITLREIERNTAAANKSAGHVPSALEQLAPRQVVEEHTAYDQIDISSQRLGHQDALTPSSSDGFGFANTSLGETPLLRRHERESLSPSASLSHGADLALNVEPRVLQPAEPHQFVDPTSPSSPLPIASSSNFGIKQLAPQRDQSGLHVDPVDWKSIIVERVSIVPNSAPLPSKPFNLAKTSTSIVPTLPFDSDASSADGVFDEQRRLSTDDATLRRRLVRKSKNKPLGRKSTDIDASELANFNMSRIDGSNIRFDSSGDEKVAEDEVTVSSNRSGMTSFRQFQGGIIVDKAASSHAILHTDSGDDGTHLNPPEEWTLFETSVMIEPVPAVVVAASATSSGATPATADMTHVTNMPILPQLLFSPRSVTTPRVSPSLSSIVLNDAALSPAAGNNDFNEASAILNASDNWSLFKTPVAIKHASATVAAALGTSSRLVAATAGLPHATSSSTLPHLPSSPTFPTTPHASLSAIDVISSGEPSTSINEVPNRNISPPGRSITRRSSPPAITSASPAISASETFSDISSDMSSVSDAQILTAERVRIMDVKTQLVHVATRAADAATTNDAVALDPGCDEPLPTSCTGNASKEDTPTPQSSSAPKKKSPNRVSPTTRSRQRKSSPTARAAAGKSIKANVDELVDDSQGADKNDHWIEEDLHAHSKKIVIATAPSSLSHATADTEATRIAISNEFVYTDSVTLDTNAATTGTKRPRTSQLPTRIPRLRALDSNAHATRVPINRMAMVIDGEAFEVSDVTFLDSGDKTRAVTSIIPVAHVLEQVEKHTLSQHVVAAASSETRSTSTVEPLVTARFANTVPKGSYLTVPAPSVKRKRGADATGIVVPGPSYKVAGGKPVLKKSRVLWSAEVDGVVPAVVKNGEVEMEEHGLKAQIATRYLKGPGAASASTSASASGVGSGSSSGVLSTLGMRKGKGRR